MKNKPDNDQRVDEPTGTEFVGHEWDGIEELDTPMPRWWVWTFYLTIVWGIVYVILYPAWPMVSSATTGVLGWTSRGELTAEMNREQERRAPILAAISAMPIEQLPENQELMQTAIAGGTAAFKVHCVQCHGSGADGIRPGSGYPNLNDDDWLWGGDIASVQYTLEHGIRNPEHIETRFSAMPAFKDILSREELDAVTAHVLDLSDKGGSTGSQNKGKGAEIYTNNCAVCHGPDGAGDRTQGAPNLADAIWLYGGNATDVRNSIANSRQGVMPRWNDKLDPVTIKMLSAFVWSLGGGERVSTEAADIAALPEDDGEQPE